MARNKPASALSSIESYEHSGSKRANNPLVGLVTPGNDPDKGGKRTYDYDPHLDPQLQWAGKSEHTSFSVPTVSLHVHEKIDSSTIIQAVRTQDRNPQPFQPSLFEEEREKLRREAVDFYQHVNSWSNRLIAGDSLLVMNSLLEKEGMEGKVQMAYMDPPYGISYGSNFQPFVGKREVKDGKDQDLTSEPEQIQAFRDTWELGIHSYLTYLRDRLLLARELLTDSGSIFVQIGEENIHRGRLVMDEVFGSGNFIRLITFAKTGSMASGGLGRTSDYLLWYAKSKPDMKYRQLFTEKLLDNFSANIGKPDGSANKINKVNRTDLKALSQVWDDTAGFNPDQKYVVETRRKVVERCLLMSTDPGDLVFDPTCGSGTTAFVSEQWGRRWITCDTSRVALVLARQRLMTAVFKYYSLARPEEGVGSGFKYENLPHAVLKSIAENPRTRKGTSREEIESIISRDADQSILYDRPLTDKGKKRVSGPFTVEAVPAPSVMPLDGKNLPTPGADISIARSGETLRQSDWRDELMRSGVRRRAGPNIGFTWLEPLAAHRWLHVAGETRSENEKAKPPGREKAGGEKVSSPQRTVISFGPDHAPMEQRQVELALQEAGSLKPAPELIIFAAFRFDPEAAKDIDETDWPNVDLLKVQMNNDLLTQDLKQKPRSSNESFRLIGKPDVFVEEIRKGQSIGQWQVAVRGFDYYNMANGDLESGEAEQIALWMLDTDYDGRCLFPRQVFFPMEGRKGEWSKLASSLRAEVDSGMLEAYKGCVSLPFSPPPEPDKRKRWHIAVKLVDSRGIESLKVVDLRGVLC